MKPAVDAIGSFGLFFKIIIVMLFVLNAPRTVAADSGANDLPVDKGLLDQCKQAVSGSTDAFIGSVVKTFARDVCRQQNDSVKAAMVNGTKGKDALEGQTATNGGADLSDADGNKKLVDTYALLFGLAVKESSCQFNCGKDQNASNSGKEEEAGAWQVSMNAEDAMSNVKPNVESLYKQYTGADAEKCFAPAAGDKSESLNFQSQPAPSCSGSIPNPGASAENWKQATKCCPAFAAEMAALVIRNNKAHNGPIVRGEAKPADGCKPVLQKLADSLPNDPQTCSKLSLPNADSAGGNTGGAKVN